MYDLALQAAENYFAALTAAPTPAEPINDPDVPAQVNQAVPTTDSVLQSLLDQVKSLQEQIDSNTSGNGKYNGQGKKKENKKAASRAYFWTHGCCAHKGS